MAVTIEGVTVGYDKAGLQQLMTDIKANVIDEAADKLDNSFDSLTTSIDNIWAGTSANIFKNNMKNDVEKIKTALQSAYVTLSAEINAIQGAMGEVDDQLVKNRD